MAVLNPLFAKYPDHPGVVHYIIHACDTPSLAPDGLAAAKHYGEIAASGPHAVHMPGHIFARLGMWQDSIDGNLRSVAAAKAEGNGEQQAHAMDYLVHAYLQLGQDAAAKRVVDVVAAPAGAAISAPSAQPSTRARGNRSFMVRFHCLTGEAHTCCCPTTTRATHGS